MYKTDDIQCKCQALSPGISVAQAKGGLRHGFMT